MSRTRLILDGKAVPLPTGTEVAITYQAHDIRHIGSRDGAYAETFELPDTNEVRDALGHSNLTSSATDTPYKLIPATLEQDYNTVLTGIAGHTEVGEGFSIEFNGLNADLFEQIKGKGLQDLDLSDLDHQYSGPNVTGANTHDPSRGYVYPLINYGYWTNRFFDATNQHFSELYPAVYVSTLLERMAAPYTLTGSLLTDPRFAKMVVPFTNEVFKYREGYTEQFNGSGLFTAPSYYSNTAKNVVFDTYSENTTGLWNAAHEYAVPAPGRYRAKITINYSATTTAIGVGLNKLYLIYRDTASNTKIVHYEVIQNGQNRTLTLDIETPILTIGDYLYLRWEPGTFDTNNMYFLAGSTMEIELKDQFVPYGQVHLEANLPDLKQEDLLLTVCNMFNVLIQTDTPRKVIRLDLLRDIRVKPALNWSRKVDWTTKPKHVFTLADYAQKNTIGFEPLDYKDIDGIERQDITSIMVDNERLDLEKEIYISPFTSTELLPSFRNTLLLPYIPFASQQVLSFGLWRSSITYNTPDYVSWGGNYYIALRSTIGDIPDGSPDDWHQVPPDEVFQFSEAKPRLLILDTRPSNSTIPVGENGVGGAFSNLNTQAVFEKPNGAGINAEAMRTQFHWITELMLKSTRLLTLKMRLNLSDISQLDFLRPISINAPTKGIEGAFYLNKVSQFNPTNASSTEVELVRLYGFPVLPPDVTAPEETELHLEYSDEYSLEYN